MVTGHIFTENSMRLCDFFPKLTLSDPKFSVSKYPTAEKSKLTGKKRQKNKKDQEQRGVWSKAETKAAIG